MHAFAIGTALLSRYPEDRAAQILRWQMLESYTENTVCSEAWLKDDLALARQRGWAVDNEEKTAGMRCVAAPILDVFGEAVAGISGSGPAKRLGLARIEEIGRLFGKAAEEVCWGLGAI